MTIEPMTFEEMPRPVQKLVKGLDIGLTFAMDAAGAAVEGLTLLGSYAVSVSAFAVTAGVAIKSMVDVVTHNPKPLDNHPIVCAIAGVAASGAAIMLVRTLNDHAREIPERFRAWRKMPLSMMS